jgi:hypothetical protein
MNETGGGGGGPAPEGALALPRAGEVERLSKENFSFK